MTRHRSWLFATKVSYTGSIELKYMILKHLVAILEMRMWYISFVHSHFSGEKCAVLHDHDTGIYLSFMLHNSKCRYLYSFDLS